MKFHALLDLPLSADGGWQQLIEDRPDPVRLFGAVVLPLSLVPPVILYLVGTHQDRTLHEGVRPLVMGSSGVAVLRGRDDHNPAFGLHYLRHVADTHKLELRYGDAYLLAAITPSPCGCRHWGF